MKHHTKTNSKTTIIYPWRLDEEIPYCIEIEEAVLLRAMIPPVAVPPGAVDRVMMTSCEIVPLITDTLTVTLPASSRTE